MSRANPAVTKTIVCDNTELLVYAAAIKDRTTAPSIPASLESIFNQLAPFAKQRRLLLVIRDTDQMEVQRERFPWYWVRGAQEVYIGLPHWKTVHQNALISAISAGLYAMVREEYVYPFRVGETLVQAGAASLFAAEVSQWEAPWLGGPFEQETRADIFRRWSHDVDGTYAGVEEADLETFQAGFGAELVRQHFSDGFDLEESLTTPVDAFRKYVLG